MVLIPYSSVPPPSRIRAAADDEIDFSKHTDTPFMAHIKLDMKKTLRNPRLNVRDKSRIYNQLLRKYHTAKENHLKESLQKTRNDSSVIPHAPAENNEHLWWDDDDMSVYAPVEDPAEAARAIAPDDGPSASYNNQDQNEFMDHELIDDEVDAGGWEYEDDDVSIHSAPELVVNRIVARKRTLNENNDPTQQDEDIVRIASKHVKMKQVSRGRRRNAIDAPPNPQARFRQSFAHAGVSRKRIIPTDHPSIIDDRFKNQTRKRQASRLFSGKKGWLGRRKKYYTPPNSKQQRFNSEDSEDEGAAAEGRWSELPK